ncbi:MAG: tRNA pseudouridine(38-40) synthase TruA [Pseudomonadota bacterium]|nr:tRNA pseudouridine(38-40) synthase TruA [Pseudomonadota bacterium]
MTYRMALGVEYSGLAYHGWQRQRDDAQTIQQHLEQALSRVANHPVSVMAAGRTDTGVHALGQVVHFDAQHVRSEVAWVLGVNRYLPPDISVAWARAVPESFNARYEALWRQYRYLILDRRARSGPYHGRVTWFHYPLDAGRMHSAAQVLVGEHDFSSFRAAACQSSTPWRRVDFVAVRRVGPLVAIDVRANAFVHHMVRNIAGVLMAVGKGDRSPDWVGEVLVHRDRTLGGVTADPHGLYLTAVGYPPQYDFPASSTSPDGDSTLFRTADELHHEGTR